MDDIQFEIDELKEVLMIRNDDIIEEKIEIITNFLVYYNELGMLLSLTDKENHNKVVAQMWDYKDCLLNMYYEVCMEQRIIQAFDNMFNYDLFIDFYKKHNLNIDEIFSTMDELYISRSECFNECIKNVKKVLRNDYNFNKQMYFPNYNYQEIETYLNNMEEGIKVLTLLKK